MRLFRAVGHCETCNKTDQFVGSDPEDAELILRACHSDHTFVGYVAVTEEEEKDEKKPNKRRR